MRKLLLAIFAPLMLMGVITLASPAFVAAAPLDSTEQACDAIKDISPDVTCNNGANTSLNKLVRLVVNTLSLVAGVVAVIMLIVSGFKFITSEGDPTKTKSARQSLIYAIVGLVVVVVAQVIVRFVLHKGSRI